MPEVFANTTPLQYLHRLGKLDWLRIFYGSVTVPGAVAAELKVGRKLGANVPEIREVPWIFVKPMDGPPGVFPKDIHRGEAELLTLGLGSGDALLIIDDGPARTHARALGLRFTGTLGIVLRAKREGLCTLVAPLLESLQREGFRIAPATFAEVLRLAGE